MAVLAVSLKKVWKYNNICFCNFQFLCGNMLYGRHSRNAMIYYLSAMVAEKLKIMPIILVLNLQKNYMGQNPDYYHYLLFAIAKVCCHNHYLQNLVLKPKIKKKL